MANISKSYSSKIIFFDSEFSSNDITAGELLSVGMVKLTGEELYLELKHSGSVSHWVERNILPTLNAAKVNRNEAIRKISNFIGNEIHYLVSYRTPYDTVYLHKLFGIMDFDKLPFYPWLIDFDSLLFINGYDPRSLTGEKLNEFAKLHKVNISKYVIHNALDDARLLRDMYLKIVDIK